MMSGHTVSRNSELSSLCCIASDVSLICIPLVFSNTYRTEEVVMVGKNAFN